MRERLKALPEEVKSPLRAGFSLVAGTYGNVRRGLGRPWQHLVVCGYPRSGTSLLYNMLGTSLPGFRFTQFEQPAAPLLRERGCIASKTPMDVFEIARMREANVWHKDILLIVPIRDFRDILTSRHPMMPAEYFIGYDFSWWPQPDGGWRYDAAGIADIHREVSALTSPAAADARASASGASVKSLLFRYEDLLADADAIQRQLGERFGLSFTSSFSSFHENKDRLVYRYEGRHAAQDAAMVLENKPVQVDRAGKWRRPEHRERIRDQFTRFPALFDLLIEAGYEQDRAWFDEYR